MTIITDMQTPSTYEQLVEASISEDPPFFLENLKDSIIISQQQDGEEVTVDQIKEHLYMKYFVDWEKQSVEKELLWYKSDERFSFNTKLAFLYPCIIFGAISCHLVHNLYFGQEIPVIIRALLIATVFISPVFVFSSMPGGRAEWINPLDNENYNSTKLSELKERQLELIDCYMKEVLPMKAEISARRYRHDVLTMIIAGEWMIYALFRFCYSHYQLFFKRSNKEIRKVNIMDIDISEFVDIMITVGSAFVLSFHIASVFMSWHSSKLVKHH
ncbi:hypothetical protein GCK72_016808 [Caenorhabditis remanei]|uniref:Uncharacterized protein n=1 Tax=Caenorhabditis remanei TaxID=31234 RepID=A0A6A5G6D1_CAERE|nr:hypothetical protein GCK72_016808 [Caenorhabditis remanei]KAF1750261.1 hypothetical protein GCK72_016808 [Caenorhabditis remanei]